MTEILHTPNKEQLVTTNAWAFLHWLRAVREIDLADWAALQGYSCNDRSSFAAAIAEFAGLTVSPLRLVRRTGSDEALVLRPHSNIRRALSRQECLAPTSRLLPTIATLLARDWPQEALVEPLADLLLHADLRPDDRLVVNGAHWPWLAALLEGTTIILAPSSDLLDTAEQERATVLVAPAAVLANVAFRQSWRRHNLAELRMIIATGGPLSPEGRRRIYTWVKAGVMLLARSGGTFWGNPLEPVLARPIGTPTFFTQPAATPAPR